MRNIIYLIEDKLIDMDNITNKLNKIARDKNTEECEFEFVKLPGTVEYKDGHLFYENEIIEQVNALFHQMKAGQRMCILLDTQLTKEDAGLESNNEYQKADLAKKIYFTFRQQVPIYIITSVPWFATQSDVIMGVDLSEQFIAKNALLKYELEEDINALFAFYQNKNISNA